MEYIYYFFYLHYKRGILDVEQDLRCLSNVEFWRFAGQSSR